MDKGVEKMLPCCSRDDIPPYREHPDSAGPYLERKPLLQGQWLILVGSRELIVVVVVFSCDGVCSTEQLVRWQVPSRQGKRELTAGPKGCTSTSLGSGLREKRSLGPEWMGLRLTH